MTTAIDPSLLSTMNGVTPASSTKGSTQETKDRFLSMLVAQMRNQDPLNPLDNAQVTSQMAQLSTVEGIENMNRTLQALADSLGVDQLAQAANLIGHSVLVPGNTVNLSDGAGVFGINLENTSDSVQISIFDQSGQLVSTVNTGVLPAGEHLFDWDGLNDAGMAMPDGNYRFEATTGSGKNLIAVQTLSSGLVQGVSRGDSGIELNVQGLGRTAYSDVRQIH
ncbi:MAG: flagellar hook assembly protein FlgD [Hydrogenophilaceae bacterium]|nr:flagellar hook assembly protein FlgD [Hydrogenophilaceae bacterium]